MHAYMFIFILLQWCPPLGGVPMTDFTVLPHWIVMPRALDMKSYPITPYTYLNSIVFTCAAKFLHHPIVPLSHILL